MPRRTEANEDTLEMEAGLVAGYQDNLQTVYEFGLVFLELLDDVEKQRGNYHTVGANRLHNKFLVTSNCNSQKFYAGGAKIQDLLIDLLDEYSWSSQALEEAFESALVAHKTRKRPK